MRDSVRVPDREVTKPEEASDQQQVQRNRSVRSLKVPGRTVPQQQTTSQPISTVKKTRESHPATLAVIDRVVSVATAILRSGGTIKPANKQYLALLDTLNQLPADLPAAEHEYVLANLAHIEKQQSNDLDTAVQRPFVYAVINCFSDTQLQGITPTVWHEYVEELMKQSGSDTEASQHTAQLLEKLTVVEDPTLQAYREQLRDLVGPAKFAAFSIPTWKVTDDTSSSISTYLSDALGNSPISEDYFDMLYARFLTTEDTLMLRRSIITIIDHAEMLGSDLIAQLRSKLGIVNLDRYPLAQLHLLAALLARDKATIERLHRRDVQLLLVDTNGDYNGELISIYDQYVQKSGSTILLEVARPSDFYRHLLFLDDYDIHPSTIIIAAHGTPQLLSFGQDKDSFNLAILESDEQENVNQVTLSQSSLERISRQFMVAGKIRAPNGKRQKKIIIASCCSEEQFANGLPSAVKTLAKPASKGRSIDVSFQDEPTKSTEKAASKKQSEFNFTLTTDQTSDTILQYDWVPGSETQKSAF